MKGNAAKVLIFAAIGIVLFNLVMIPVIILSAKDALQSCLSFALSACGAALAAEGALWLAFKWLNLLLVVIIVGSFIAMLVGHFAARGGPVTTNPVDPYNGSHLDDPNAERLI